MLATLNKRAIAQTRSDSILYISQTTSTSISKKHIGLFKDGPLPDFPSLTLAIYIVLDI